MKRKLILASRSPRRRQLLADAGYSFEVVEPSAGVECGVCSRESPAELVARLAFEKAADVARRVGRGLVLGCDTVAEVDGEVLGKPDGEALARRMLEDAARAGASRVERSLFVERAGRRADDACGGDAAADGPAER